MLIRALQVADEASFRAAIDEFERTDPGWDFAFDWDPDGEFPDYVEMLAGWPQGKGLVENRVPSTFLVAVRDGQIVGRLSLRHSLNEFLESYGGHIGYGVIASCRRQGVASALMKHGLDVTQTLGIDRVLVTCDDDNTASIIIIERSGGVLEDKRAQPDGTVTRRYWIENP